MEIKLNYLKAGDLLNNTGQKSFLYGDFNVLNALYEKGIQLNQCLIYPDSSLMHLLLRFVLKSSHKKIVSTDLLYQILDEAVKRRKTIFFFGDTSEVLRVLKYKLYLKYPGILIAGTYPGYYINSMDVIEFVNKLQPDILFIGLGVARQEEWLYHHLQKLETQFIFTTGGWFRYLAGINKRCPGWMRKMSLEWLYKLCTEFSRVWRRYLMIAPRFIYRVLSHKIILKLDCENSFF